MCIYRGTDKEFVAYIYIYIIYVEYIYVVLYFSALKIEETPVICHNIDVTGGYYLNKIFQMQKTNAIWSQIYVESNQTHRAENWVLVFRSRGKEKIGINKGRKF